ncbi:MAG: hypothetical protein AB1744_00690 [Candidatus Zixiibacteriota bacterium]|jgi:hypothetical protein
MNARTVFVFGLLFTLMNIVMAFTTHAGLFMMAIIGLMVMVGAASKIWPDVVRPSQDRIYDDPHRDSPVHDDFPSNTWYTGSQ